MRRVLAVLFLLVPALASAQFGQGDGGIRLQGVTGVAGTGSGGATFTAPVLLSDGSGSAPALAFSSIPGLGFYKWNSATIALDSNETYVPMTFGSGLLALRSSANIGWSSGNLEASGPDLYIGRDAANTLALRNSTNAQQFNVYNSFTTAGSNYGVFSIVASATGTDLIGTGVGATASTGGLRSIQGSKSKALTEGAATTVVTVAVPQTAGSNFAAGEFKYTVYASDGTDSQALNGVAKFSAVNKAGTETCTLEDDQITDEAASAGTLACTVTCVVGLTDVVGIALDCTSSLTQTTLNGLYRLDMQQVNTVAPQ